jgi:hypothetical protein
VTEARRAEVREPPGFAARLVVDCVVTHHLNPFASGVVRFNEILAERLGVPYLGLFDDRLLEHKRPLLSLKVSELGGDEREALERLLDGRGYQVYLHDWSGLPLERRLATGAQHVWCGNLEISELISGLNANTEVVWTPGLLADERRYHPAEISLFSFGMAHKIRADMFRRLRNLLERSGRSYAIYVSSANHETKSIRDAQAVFEEMNEIFPHGLYFLGNLSDVAVYNHLQTTTYFASFFPRGVRDNNTSVAAAMEQGSVVITNLDRFSPPHLVHMENVIDINRCEALPTDPLVIKRLSLGAMEAARSRSWDRLANRLQFRDARSGSG